MGNAHSIHSNSVLDSIRRQKARVGVRIPTGLFSPYSVSGVNPPLRWENRWAGGLLSPPYTTLAR
eukprot:6642130-Prymnesium_polylepis.1